MASMRYIWQVLERELEDAGDSKHTLLPEMQCGVSQTFEEATHALSSWQGAEDDPPHRMYLIIPILEDEKTQSDSETERIRIVAYLMHDTTYSDDFCLRCSHCPTNCECTDPVYMQGWSPSKELAELKTQLHPKPHHQGHPDYYKDQT
jgi:hypothetical protein